MIVGADSDVVSTVAWGRGYTRGLLPPRASYAAIVLHTTGGGIIKRWRKQQPKFRETSPFYTALRVYSGYGDPRSDGLMAASGHYVIGPYPGEVAQVVPERLAAWHVGGAGSGKYASRGWSRKYSWWLERWHPHTSPLDLARGEIWRGGSCNANTIGIEIVPNPDDPSGPLTDAAWAAIVSLTRDIRRRRQIPTHPERTITHSDAHPLSRCDAAGMPWDLRMNQFRWSEYRRRANI